MSAWKCNRCEINLPDRFGRRPCPGCGGDLAHYTHALASRRWENWYWQRTGRDQRDQERVGPFPPNTKATVMHGNEGWLWVENNELEEIGYTPDDFLVVMLNGQLYELQGRNGHGWWWIEEVQEELSEQEVAM